MQLTIQKHTEMQLIVTPAVSISPQRVGSGLGSRLLFQFFLSLANLGQNISKRDNRIPFLTILYIQ